MNIGDTIRCYDKDDLINMMIECARAGIETDFNYDDDKPKLVVTAIRKEEHDRLQTTRDDSRAYQGIDS